ncbi:MAG: hypothetical protein AAGA53_02995 [Pseudomonadota bacterium]
MATYKAKNPSIGFGSPTLGTAEFNRRVEEGLKRAPEERAKAIKEFWCWIRSAA